MTRRAAHQTVAAPVMYACTYGISVAQTHIGGQDVVHITRSENRKTPFMDVRASDLLISYEYDKKGHLVDRTVWFDNDPQVDKKNNL